MHSYTPDKREEDLVPWPPIEETLDVTILEGNPKVSMRMDFNGSREGVFGGIWSCTPGRFHWNFGV